MSYKLIFCVVLIFIVPDFLSASPTIFFKEDFEDTNLGSHGWYDNIAPEFSTTEVSANSTQSLQRRFLKGATTPVRGGAMRRQFADTESLYVSYDIRYSNNWEGSGTPYPPHEIYILTNKDGPWSGLAFTHLTTYIENHNGYPRLALQDGRNIDQDRIGVNLVSITENRSLMGCNGDSDGHGYGSCYNSGSGIYWNGKQWISKIRIIFPGQWHKIGVYYKMNSIVNGKGIPDGILRYWLDGQLVMDYNNIVYRTGRHHDMKFNQLVIAPYIGTKSPIDQSFWIDNIVLSELPLNEERLPVFNAPTNLRIISYLYR
jgi:hypothetical protein